jgi:RibD C-terminal domain.
MGADEVAGPTLARALDTMGLIDEFRIYLRPAVLGEGKRYFAFARPPLRLIAHQRIGADVICLRYQPAG